MVLRHLSHSLFISTSDRKSEAHSTDWMARLRFRFFKKRFFFYRREKKINFPLFLKQMLKHIVFWNKNIRDTFNEKIASNFFSTRLIMSHISSGPLLEKGWPYLIYTFIFPPLPIPHSLLIHLIFFHCHIPITLSRLQFHPFRWNFIGKWYCLRTKVVYLLK